jgi:cell division protein FtsW (lipid II flippase)
MGQLASYLFGIIGGWDLSASVAAVLALVLVLGTIGVRLVAGRRLGRNSPWRPILKRFFRYGLGLGVVGLALVFLRYEQVQYLSGVWILYLWMILVVAWTAWLVWGASEIPNQLEQRAEQQRKERWMGKNTKKRKR